MNKKAKIDVRSSSSPDALYTITIERSEEKAKIMCSCPAGKAGQLCKHVLAVLQNDASILNKGEKAAWTAWCDLFSGSELEALAADFLYERDELENQIESLQRKNKDIKKKFARIALG